MSGSVSKLMEIAVAIGRTAWGVIGSQLDQTVRSFRIVRLAAFNPAHYYRMLKKSAVFAVAMAEGGICVPSSSAEEKSKTPEIYSLIQFDGDILTKVASETLGRPPDKQAAIIKRHFQDVEAALSPLLDMQALIRVSWGFGLALTAMYASLVEAAALLGDFAVFTDFKMLLKPGLTGRHLPTILLLVMSAMTPNILRYCMRRGWEKQLQKFLKASRNNGNQASNNKEGENYSPKGKQNGI